MVVWGLKGLYEEDGWWWEDIFLPGSSMREYVSGCWLVERGICMRGLLGIVVVVDGVVDGRRHCGNLATKIV